MPSSDTKWDIHLPTAGQIIGWLNVGLCILEFMYVAYLISDMPAVETAGWGFGNPEEAKMMAYSILSMGLIFIFVDFISSVLLIAGIDQHKSAMLLPWIIVNGLSIATRLFSNTYLMIMWAITLAIPFGNLGYFLFNIVFTGFHCWIWLLIYYLYKYLADTESG